MSSLEAGLKPLVVAPLLGVVHPSPWGPVVRVPGLRWVGMKMAQAPSTLELVISAPILACTPHIHTHKEALSPEGTDRKATIQTTAESFPWVEMRK